MIPTVKPAIVYRSSHLSRNKCSSTCDFGDYPIRVNTNLFALARARSTLEGLRMLLLPAPIPVTLLKTTACAGLRLTILSTLVLVGIHLFVCSCVRCDSIAETMQVLFKSFALTATLQLSHLATAQTTVDGSRSICKHLASITVDFCTVPPPPPKTHSLIPYVAAADPPQSTIAPAGQTVDGEFVLTDTVLADLEAQGISNISLFDFSKDSQAQKRAVLGKCKTASGDYLWPVKAIWDVLDQLTGGAIIQTVPLSSVCYGSWGNYDAAECARVTEQWADVNLHIQSPSDLMFPTWEGTTCIPPEIATNDPTGNCTVGGYPLYVVNATTVAQIQLSVNLARNLNLRLVVKSTGHDFNGRSAGAGALSIWMNSWKDVHFYEKYQTSTYSGPALKIGAGLENRELFAAAEEYGVTGVGGLCTTVAAGGGFMAGGGHGPMTSSLGLAADQVRDSRVFCLPPWTRADDSIGSEHRRGDTRWALRHCQ